ncbi:type II secretion system minor pseudopilin GspI [Gammaproteobacteria bacterium]|nr:type II secretion system minor pseudopilin GspI [Gammaproteobacteria bacterium]MDA9353340.1 type II secretion system minor pseudopilin GspI [Gammaproteobacteria bacterium]MDB9973944.1 type II secretion system minor pseudopilin GspI [Gammaproteobacteria bacterium]
MNIEKGFSLFEIVIALVILSVSLLVIYKLILSTSVSIYKLEDHYLAKEVANNRVALINTIEKPSKPLNRNGIASMGGKNWRWEESFYNGISPEFLEYEILIKSENSTQYSYRTKGYLVNE